MCYNHYLAKEYHKENVLITCIVLLLFFPSIQTVAASCYYGTEIPLQCMHNLKKSTLFSVASVLEFKIIHIKVVKSLGSLAICAQAHH